MANRPLSPHLQIYRPQLTSVLSITHRATGVFLSLGTLLLSAWLLALADGPQAYLNFQNFTASWIGMLLLIGWSASLYYHLCNGIRHLFWDAGLGFDLQNTYRSGWAVLIGSGLLTLITWLVACQNMGGQ